MSQSARRSEVGVEDGDEFAGGGFEALVESAGFKSDAVGAVEIDDRVAHGPVAFDDGSGDFFGFVGGVVEDLDLQQLARIFDLADGVDEAVDDELLVEDGELDGDAGQLLEMRRRLVRGILAVAVVEPDQRVAVEAVEGEDDHHGEIGGQQRRVEREKLPVVEVLEGVVAVVGAQVVAEVVFDEEEGEGLGAGQQGLGGRREKHEGTGYSG